MMGVLCGFYPRLAETHPIAIKFLGAQRQRALNPSFAKKREGWSRSADAKLGQGLCGWLRMSGHRLIRRQLPVFQSEYSGSSVNPGSITKCIPVLS